MSRACLVASWRHIVPEVNLREANLEKNLFVFIKGLDKVTELLFGRHDPWSCLPFARSHASPLSHSLGPAMVPHWPFRARRMEWMRKRNTTVALHRSSISYLGVMLRKFGLSAESVSNSRVFGWSASQQMVDFSKVFISLIIQQMHFREKSAKCKHNPECDVFTSHRDCNVKTLWHVWDAEVDGGGGRLSAFCAPLAHFSQAHPCMRRRGGQL